MYSIFQIYKNDVLIQTIVSNLNPDYADSTKLDILLNTPSTLQSIYSDYFDYSNGRSNDRYSITTFKT